MFLAGFVSYNKHCQNLDSLKETFMSMLWNLADTFRIITHVVGLCRPFLLEFSIPNIWMGTLSGQATVPFWFWFPPQWMSTLKRKEFAPQGANYFLKGWLHYGKALSSRIVEQEDTKNVPMCKKLGSVVQSTVSLAISLRGQLVKCFTTL